MIKQKEVDSTISGGIGSTQTSFLGIWRLKEGEILLVYFEGDCIRLQAVAIHFESSIVLRALDFHCPIGINLKNCEGASPPRLELFRKDMEL